jgi:hypothetical protein
MAGKGSAPGERRGGRQKGARNKATQALEHRGNPLVLLSSLRVEQILRDRMPCSVCKGKKQTLYRLPEGTHSAECKASGGGKCTCKGIGHRPCASCNESGYEELSPELIGKVAIAVRGEAYPQLKAVEHSNPDGTLRPQWVVVKPGEAPK